MSQIHVDKDVEQSVPLQVSHRVFLSAIVRIHRTIASARHSIASLVALVDDMTDMRD